MPGARPASPAGDRADAIARAPGDVRPAATRPLDRPPGERLVSREAPPAAAHPATGRALALGLAGWAGVAVVWLLLEGVLGLDWGMVVVALAGGWLIGALVAAGAWRGERHVQRIAPRVLAIGFALAAWGTGQVLVYLWTRATLPDSRLDIAQRIAATPFPAYFGGIVGPLEVIEVVLTAVGAFLAAR